MRTSFIYVTGLMALLGFLGPTVGCSQQSQNIETTIQLLDTARHLRLYAARKQHLASQRQMFQAVWQRAENDSTRTAILATARKRLIQHLTDSLFPMWHGTPWDFNGHCAAPLSGETACGYFVSTPVKHAGLNLNRYKLAQQYSFDIVKTLCNQPIKRIGHGNLDALLQWIASQPDDLYIIGLDNHVGWLHRKHGQTWFVHSNYLGPVAVEQEVAATSAALNSSENYVLGRFLSTDALVLNWLLNRSYQ